MKIKTFADLKKYLPDGFIAGIILMILLAWLLPGIGGKDSFFHLSDLIHFGIALLFFFYGLRLSPEKLKNDLKNWRLHLLIQSITFILFPFLVLLFRPFLKGTENEVLWLAVFFLAALPSTVSSSVVMVSIAEGNIPSAIFNASISGVIGILITPLWMGIFLEKQDEAFAFGAVLTDLVIQILIPVILGLLMHRFWGRWATHNKKYLSLFDKSVILCIVYRSFSDSFLNGIFGSTSWTELILLSGSVIALFFVVFNLTKMIIRLMKFNREDGITVLFCASKKSLVHGSVMASVIFAGSSAGGIFLVPVMIYHAFQLFYISIVARRMNKRN
ncbi:MAG TPA: bile acid:sodium symporter family protein [Prolixibacteraceae bacterium]|nr:bile acid:sodium symporter family protein [Prolixibacteraceae bacterium]